MADMPKSVEVDLLIHGKSGRLAIVAIAAEATPAYDKTAEEFANDVVTVAGILETWVDGPTSTDEELRAKFPSLRGEAPPYPRLTIDTYQEWDVCWFCGTRIYRTEPDGDWEHEDSYVLPEGGTVHDPAPLDSPVPAKKSKKRS